MPRWFTHPQTTHPSTNLAVYGREKKSQSVDHKSDALTTTLPSHLKKTNNRLCNLPVELNNVLKLHLITTLLQNVVETSTKWCLNCVVHKSQCTSLIQIQLLNLHQSCHTHTHTHMSTTATTAYYHGNLCNKWAGCSPKNPVGMKSIGLSFEDAQDMNYWRLRIEEATG